MTNKNKTSDRRGFLHTCLRVSGLFALAPLTSYLWAGNRAVIQSVRISSHGSKTRIIFDSNASLPHKIFTLHSPERVVIDFEGVELLDRRLDRLTFRKSTIKRIRYAARDKTNLRVVLDLALRASPRSYELFPGSQFGHRFVVDLHPQGNSAPAPVLTTKKNTRHLRDVVIAIDAGHGGKDPGAIGKRGTREKDVVLAISRKLESLVRKEKGMRPVMIRKRDVFLPLRSRIQKARDSQADLFISIHADAARNRRARGASVYVLSKYGASSEAARWLAERENAVDLVGGVSLDDKDDLLAKVLLDLSQNATIEASMDLANDMLREFKRIGRVHSARVEQAGFVVLKSPDIPSVLVETAYISNSREEKLLRRKSYQTAIAKSILRGIKEYFEDNAPPGTLLASLNRTKHVIRSGETLSVIAQRYDVDIKDIRKHNALKSDRIRVGQVLFIPTSDG